MPAPVVKKAALAGAAGLTGAGILAWRTQFPWIKYDFQMMQAGKRIMDSVEEANATFVVDKFEAMVDKQPKKTMLIFEDLLFSYEFVDQQANRVANLLRQQGLGEGDTVAMMVHSEPAFVWTFFGLQKLGVTAALINYNLRAKQLSFSIRAAEPKALIVGSGQDLLEAVQDVAGDLPVGLPVLLQGVTPGSGGPPGDMVDMDLLTRHVLPVRPDPSVRSGLTDQSVGAYVYTSGTTGLPKPAFINQQRLKGYTCALQIVGAGPEDVVYTVVPLYHVSGMGIGLLSLLKTGGTIVLRRKFSASNFWSDCRKYKVTIVQYIGEIFRYLLAQPEHELDSVHTVRVAIGNGLRKDIFEKVQKRFKLPMICELFGATEGVSALFNVANKPGAIGRMSPFMERLDPNPKVLVKFDYTTALPIRNRNGRCIRVKPGEPGLFLSRVPDNLVQKGDLSVYKASREANQKKLVRNVFKEGDLYFNYGDVFYVDKDYFVYFHDRIGDTFRWKGENVSTTEVANILSAPDFIDDANVYGVQVPGHDGRACMVALTLSTGERMTPERLQQMHRLCQDDLPSYARPLFLRVLTEAVMTGTFKQRKVELVQQGYDLTKVKDDLYYLDSKAKTYSPLTAEALVSFLQSKL
ncbi:long-chain fatty acid transport protein 6-like [Babylonia areolata]|uniref:long-chain fatty acid transport protein 6-like n=1 Tax=Babylonia areolata TaxID=304850 RepID=UPI003FD3E7F0